MILKVVIFLSIEALLETPKKKEVKIVDYCTKTFIGDHKLLPIVYLALGLPMILISILLVYGYTPAGKAYNFLGPAIALFVNANLLEPIIISSLVYGDIFVGQWGSNIVFIANIIITLFVLIIVIQNSMKYLEKLILSFSKMVLSYLIYTIGSHLLEFSVILLTANSLYEVMLSYAISEDRIYLYVPNFRSSIFELRVNYIINFLVLLILTIIVVFLISKSFLAKLKPIVIRQGLINPLDGSKKLLPNCIDAKIKMPNDHLFVTIIENVDETQVELNVQPQSSSKELWNINVSATDNKIKYVIEPLKKIDDGKIDILLKTNIGVLKARGYEVSAFGPSLVPIFVSAQVVDMKEEEILSTLDREYPKVPLTMKIKDLVNDVLSRINVPPDLIGEIRVTVSGGEETLEVTTLDQSIKKAYIDLNKPEVISMNITFVIKPSMEVTVAGNQKVITFHTYDYVKVIDFVNLILPYLDISSSDIISKIIIDSREYKLEELSELKFRDLVAENVRSLKMVIETSQ